MSPRDYDDAEDDDDEVPIILCLCGQTLRLPGAIPGRVGHCPACGEEFRVPEMGRVVPQRPLLNTDDDDDGSPPGGYDLAPPSQTSPSGPRMLRSALGPVEEDEERPKRKRKARADRKPIEAVGRGGVFPLPRRPEETLLGSLRYPLWDGMGLMALILLPLGLSFTSVLVFGVMPWALKTGGLYALVVPIIIGFVVIFAFLFAFTLATGGVVLAASAMGEVHHPRWPDLDIGVLVGTLLRWGLAWGLGLGLIYLPLRWLLPSEGEIDLLGQVIRGLLLSVGGLYALVALLAVILHDDLGAISPTRVLPAIIRLGPRVFGVWGLLAASIVIGIVAVAVVHKSAEFGVPILLTAAWVAWVFAVYAGLVVLRALGRNYDLRSEEVGWFEKIRIRDEDSGESARVPPEIPDF